MLRKNEQSSGQNLAFPAVRHKDSIIPAEVLEIQSFFYHAAVHFSRKCSHFSRQQPQRVEPGSGEHYFRVSSGKFEQNCR